jgi:hypothetical protein
MALGAAALAIIRAGIMVELVFAGSKKANWGLVVLRLLKVAMTIDSIDSIPTALLEKKDQQCNFLAS